MKSVSKPEPADEFSPKQAVAKNAEQALAKGEPAPPKNPLAGCTLCHVDIEDEFIGCTHFDEKVACVDCHGQSEGHLANENNEVKPDEMFARVDVDRLCGRCHECDRAKPPKPELAADGLPKVCIDCHGPHDLAPLSGN